jgi:hypothetical protein
VRIARGDDHRALADQRSEEVRDRAPDEAIAVAEDRLYVLRRGGITKASYGGVRSVKTSP